MRMSNSTGIALTVLLVGCGSLTFERELKDVNAVNYPGIVVIDPDTPFRAAVWAQEAYESQRKTHPFELALIRADSSRRRDMELVGHEIETQVAARLYGQSEMAYRRKEAHALKYAYGDLFKKSDVADVEDQMMARRSLAIEWVSEHWGTIRRQM